MREVSNLAWPASPYSSAHRPIHRHVHLLTGLAIGPTGWAAVHLPTHRTRTLTAADARFGIHAAITDEALNPSAHGGAWVVLDRLILAARRQAAAIAAHSLVKSLTRLTRHPCPVDVSYPGIASLLPEWPECGRLPTSTGPSRAQLIELDGLILYARSAALLSAYPDPQPTSDADDCLAALVTRAAVTALVAAQATGRYDLSADLDLPELLDTAAGDLLTFTRP